MADPGDPFHRSIEVITATDDEIRAHLAAAELPPLLGALAYATGDMGLLRPELRPDPLTQALPQGGLNEDQQAAIRQLAFDAIVAFRDGGSVTAAPPSDDDVLAIMEHTVYGEAMGPYLPLLEEELAHRGADPRAPGWRLEETVPTRHLDVVVIGAGMSGILAGHRLDQAGVPYTILEKNPDVGGTWLENTYPGCRVDNPNHNYSYSFAQRHDWPFHFSTADVLRDYFATCADAFGVREHVRFGVEVTSCTWSEEDQRWTVRYRHAGQPDAPLEAITAAAVISAVGQLNRPLYPNIDGRDDFVGESFHSARWDHTIDLAGKRVGVIGTGASAVQFVPEIAPTVGSMTVFQRTPPWLGPTEEYHAAVPEGLRWLYMHIPSYSEWNRFWIFWRMGDGALDAVRVDPDYVSADGGAVSETNEIGRMLLSMMMELSFEGRPDLFEKCLPSYPVGAKRMLRDNGSWPGALMRDNVTLETTGIERITPTGVRLVDGTEIAFDVLIYGTGFQASKFLTPMTVTGRGGVDLHEQWAGEPRAYLGVAIPSFPNFFCLYGPNTNIVINGSIIYFSECATRYVLGCLQMLAQSGAGSMEVRRDVHDTFNVAVDAQNALMAWGASSVNSWYKTESGHIAQNWPFTLLEYWQRTLEPNKGDYSLTGSATR